MNIFSRLKYWTPWTISDKRNLTQEEKDTVENAEIVESDFGMSVCFTLFNGETSKVPLSTVSNSKAHIGDIVDLDSISIITLHNDYDEEIHRIEL